MEGQDWVARNQEPERLNTEYRLLTPSHLVTAMYRFESIPMQLSFIYLVNYLGGQGLVKLCNRRLVAAKSNASGSKS